MKQIFLSSKECKAAAILLDSSRDLYKSYGDYAQTYFKMLQFIYGKVRTISDSIELRNTLEELISSIKFEIVPCNETEDFVNFDEIVLAAVELANGSYLSVEKGTETKIDNSDAEFTFKSDFTGHLSLSDVKVLVFNKEDQDYILRSVQQTFEPGKPLVIITTFESGFLSKFAKDNEVNGIYHINARPTYLSSDFFTDLTSFLNQTPIVSKLLSKETAGTALTISAIDGVIRLTSKRSIQRSILIKNLSKEIDSEKSVNRRMLIQKRLINLVYSKTTLYVSAPTQKEQDLLISKFASQVAEISNCIESGAVKTNPISDTFNGLSRKCFVECLMKAAQDILLCKDSKILEINA